MKITTIGVSLVGIFISIGAYSQTVNEIINRQIAALGGRNRLEGVKTIKLQHYSVDSTGKVLFGNDYWVIVGRSSYSNFWKKGVRGESTEIINGNNGKGWKVVPTWMGGTGKTGDLSLDEIHKYINEGKLDPFGYLINYKKDGNKWELIGKERLGNRNTYHLRFSVKNGKTVDWYIDDITYLPVRSIWKFDVTYSDYRSANGIKFAYRTEYKKTNPTILLILNAVSINKEINESVFDKPEN